MFPPHDRRTRIEIEGAKLVSLNKNAIAGYFLLSQHADVKIN
jgi:hypothetical protein